MLQAEERASAKVEYRSEKFNITIKESRIRLGQRKINVSFGGPLNIPQVKKQYPAAHVVSISTASMK